MRRRPMSLLAACAAVLLAACGSGGGGSPATDAPADASTTTLPVSSSSTGTSVTATTAGASSTSTTITSSSTSSTSSATTTTATVAGTLIEISVADGAVTGGGRVGVALGDRVVLRVTADVADEVHVHGYDLVLDVRPGETAELEFEAGVPGVFEVELESAGTELLLLEVGG